MAVPWNNSLATGSDEIDQQHKELFKRVNGLLAAVDKGTVREETSQIVQYLTDYVFPFRERRGRDWQSAFIQLP